MVEFIVNGKTYSVDMEPSANLLWVIREHLKLAGTKYGCGEGACGACTIHATELPEKQKPYVRLIS